MRTDGGSGLVRGGQVVVVVLSVVLVVSLWQLREGPASQAQALTPFDTGHPAIANLEPSLLQAVQQAARDAREDGIELLVTSGWRSEEEQQRLLDDAVDEYGSLEEARRFVKTPEESTHVSGTGVDIGPTDADDWLIRHGSGYGLCQTYANEMWHFELMTTPGGRCPPPLTDASYGSGGRRAGSQT
jgi:D-alanyl-D-alanine carboxypeptidase